MIDFKEFKVHDKFNGFATISKLAANAKRCPASATGADNDVPSQTDCGVANPTGSRLREFWPIGGC